MTSRRIALLHPFAWPEVRRGGERYLDDLARYLAGAGHHVEVVTGTTGPSGASEAGDPGAPFLLRRLHQPASARLARRGLGAVEIFGAVALPRLLRRRYDVVHALTPTAALAARAARQATVYTLLGLPHRGWMSDRPGQRRLARSAVRAATEVAGLSEAAARGCEEAFGRRPVVLPPGVHLDRFPTQVAPRTGAPRVLLSSDVTDPRKGVDRLLAAFPHVLDRRPDARLAISSGGDWSWALEALGPDRARVEAAVDALGAGSPEDVPQRYRHATVTVLPSTGEAFGMVLVESLASGTPVVCNDDGGMPEIVSDRDVGRVADAGDPRALAAAIVEVVELAAAPGTAERCAAHARRWDWEAAVGPAHEALYERALAGARR